MSDGNNKIRSKRERELRLQAVQIASMLPDDPAEAQKVLTYVQRLVTDYIDKEPVMLGPVKRE